VNILYPASAHHSCVIEVFFERIHDSCSRKQSKESVSSRKIRFQLLSHSFDCIFSDLNQDLLEKLVPFGFLFLFLSLYDQLFLSLMIHKSFSKLLCSIINILAKIHQDGGPYIIRSYFNIAMIYVSLVKSIEKSILACHIHTATLLIA